jgi:hypothetical protein
MILVDDPAATIFAAAIQGVATVVGAILALIGGILVARRQERKAQDRVNNELADVTRPTGSPVADSSGSSMQSPEVDQASVVNVDDDEADNSAVLTRSTEAERGYFYLMREYVYQGLAQSRIGRLFGLIFSFLGLAILGASLLSYYLSGAISRSMLAVSLVSALVFEIVAGLLFVQSVRTIALMSELIERVRSDQGLEEAIRLTLSIPDTVNRSYFLGILALRRAGIPVSGDAAIAKMKG